ncbi:MAG: SDR family oxidoreductase [Pseudomonadota bacterium]
MSNAQATSKLQPDRAVAIVTGAQQGIGAAAAVRLAEANHHVVVNYLDDGEAAAAVAAEIERSGQQAALVRGDMRETVDLAGLITAAAKLGTPRVLVNNAAVFPRSPFLEMPLEEWDLIHGVNLRAVFLMSQMFAQHLVEAGTPGNIVNLTSGAAFRGSPRGAHYVAAKAGVVGLTKAMSQELAPHGIRVNAVAPGITDTAQPRYGMTEEEIAEAGRGVPLGRISTPEDIADSIVFLTSDKAAQITGQILHVNGGGYLA